MVAYSSHSGQVDDIRRESILVRHPPPAVADWLGRYGLASAVRPLRIPADRKRGILGRLCIPICWRGSRVGYLWLIDDQARLSETDVRTGVRAAEQAGLLMLDDLLAERLASRALGHLLSPLAEVRLEGLHHIDNSGLLGLSGQVAVLVVQSAGPGRQMAQRPLAESLRDVTRGYAAGKVVSLTNADHGVLVARGLDDRAAEFELASAARRELLRRLRQDDPGACVAAGIGNPVSALADAHLAYCQARHAARVAATITATGPVARWRDLGVFRLLAQLPADGDATASLDPRLMRLFNQADEQVVSTLETYLDLAGQIKATAERLHLHRGTLYYRLQKAQQMAGINLRDGDDRLAIHIGFKLARLSGLYPRQAIDHRDTV
jgi:hypothetical protein